MKVVTVELDERAASVLAIELKAANESLIKTPGDNISEKYASTLMIQTNEAILKSLASQGIGC